MAEVSCRTWHFTGIKSQDHNFPFVSSLFSKQTFGINFASWEVSSSLLKLVFCLIWSNQDTPRKYSKQRNYEKRSCILTWQLKIKLPPKGSDYEFLFSSLHDPKRIRHQGQATHGNTQTLGKQPQSNDFRRCLLEKLDITRGPGRKQIIQGTCSF